MSETLAALLKAHAIVWENDGGDYGGRSWFECACDADNPINPTEYATEDEHREHVAATLAANTQPAPADREACPACDGAMPPHQMSAPMQAIHAAHSADREGPAGGLSEVLHSDDAVTVVARELIHPAERYNPASIDVARPIAEAVLRALRSHLADLADRATNPHLPEPPADGKHIFNGGYRCVRCGVYNHPAESNREALEGPCQGRWAHSGKLRSAAEDKWAADREVCSEFIDTGRCGHSDADHDAIADREGPAGGLSEGESLWPPFDSYHWRCAEGLLKLTRWEEWRRWGIRRQSDEIGALAAALSKVIPEGDVGNYVERQVAARLAAAVRAPDAGLRARVEAALDADLTPSLRNAEWACDPLPSCPNYAHVNPDWLRALIREANAMRAALAAEDAEDGE